MKELTRTDVVLHVALQQAVFMVLEGFWWPLVQVWQGFMDQPIWWLLVHVCEGGLSSTWCL